MHRVNGDIKDNMTGKMLYKLDGEWNGKMKFTDECEVIDANLKKNISYWYQNIINYHLRS